MKPRLLDLFCGAGGAGRGYADAGWEVVGVDLFCQPRYPFEFRQYDALSLLRDYLGPSLYGGGRFDAIHASPPCQAHSDLRHAPGARHHDDLIPATRELLAASGLPYVIENVEGAPLRDPITLCGSMFGLGADGFQLRRHRLFESNVPLTAPPCAHTSPVIGVYGGHVRCRSAVHGGRRTRDFEGKDKPALAREAMGIDWMTMTEISQAIPPAYTQHIGGQLLAACARMEAAR